MGSKQRLVLVVAIMASFVAFLDGSVVNVALPAIVRELGGGLVLQQWVADAYLLTLGSLILVAGSLSDLYGRKKVLLAGLLGFAVTSAMCALAPSGAFLVAARALQGIAGALLVPSSLALIMSSFSGRSTGRAIGAWTAWTGIAFVVGPLLGGALVDMASWRWVFAINMVPIAVTIWLMSRLHQVEEVKRGAKVDVMGALLCAFGLGGIVYALIEQGRLGFSDPIIYSFFILGSIALALFVFNEKRISHPMMPLNLFKARNFSVGNVATVAIYAGLSVATFLITIFVQQVGGYSAFGAGMAVLPVTVIMFFLSPRFGALASAHGPRLFMSIGPIVAGAGFLWMLFVGHEVAYWTQLFPGILMFGVGLSITVAPLTTAILSAVEKSEAGIGSAVNNAVARIAGLVAIAGLGFLTGPNLDLEGFHRGVVAMATLLFIGGIISAAGIKNKQRRIE